MIRRPNSATRGVLWLAAWTASALGAAFAASSAENPPRQLKDFRQLRTALTAGARVRAVFHYRDMKLFVGGKEETKIADAVGGMDVGAFEDFAPGSAGNDEGFVAFSHSRLIKHPRYGAVLDYVNVTVFETGRVRILAESLAPGTYAVKTSRTFESEVNNGANKAGAFFFLLE
jgi:hypothetical protein